VNRETKRLMQRQGQVGPDGAPVRRVPPTPTQAPKVSGSGIANFLRGVRSELKKVAWPDRAEVVNYSTVVFVTLTLLIFAIFGLNLLFGHAVTLLLGA
jgi:preprotein translocase subunit SecE